MKKINAIILLSSLTSASVFAGAYVENREAYNLASDQGEVMLRVGYNFDMGAGIMLTNTYTFQREDELKHGYNEIEGWYPLFKPTDKLTIQPGGLINDKSIGSGGAVYLDVNYKFVPWFNLTVRNRYNHNKTGQIQYIRYFQEEERLVSALPLYLPGRQVDNTHAGYVR